jgi:CheY-like chemotaxis protein
VKLPLKEVSREADPSPLPPGVETPNYPHCSLPNSLTDLNILVVDDSADAREFITTVLEQYQAKVTAVASVAEALKTLEQLKPNVLVSDIGMPGENGYYLIRKLREMEAERGGNIPAVALTAYARDEDREQAIKAGFQMHLPKPVDPVKLAAVVANLATRGSSW